MSTLINVILLVALGFAAFFIVKRMRGHQKPEHVVPKDPKSQAIYNEVKHKDEEKITLTLQEKIELSWQFLTKPRGHCPSSRRGLCRQRLSRGWVFP